MSVEDTVRNAAALIRAGAQAVKLEGGAKRVRAIEAIVDAEIPVMGHLGLTPQSVHAMGGFRVQAKQTEAALGLVAEAKALAAAGCFAIVLEGVPDQVAAMVTAAVDVPTIGIGAGAGCDGQVLVFHDVLGFEDRLAPKFVRRYADLRTRRRAGPARLRRGRAFRCVPQRQGVLPPQRRRRRGARPLRRLALANVRWVWGSGPPSPPPVLTESGSPGLDCQTRRRADRRSSRHWLRRAQRVVLVAGLVACGGDGGSAPADPPRGTDAARAPTTVDLDGEDDTVPAPDPNDVPTSALPSTSSTRVRLPGFGEVEVQVRRVDGEVVEWCLLLAETDEQRAGD